MANIDVIEAGQSIDQYKIVRLIANTQKSHLYLVEAKGLHKQFVLKLFAAKTTPSSIKKFVDQANLLLEFTQSPHIVNIMHLSALDERPYMVMPYYPQTLNDLLAVHYQKLSFISSLGFIKQVLSALQSLHHLGVVHLDIKPQNLFLDEANNIELADFDSALVLKNSPLFGRFENSIDALADALSYTIAYASPEQIDCIAPATVLEKSSDLYSLGALWFRILVGDTLFKLCKEQEIGTSKNEFIKAQLNDLAPPWCTQLITDLLNNDAASRPSIDNCFAQIEEHVQTPHINQTISIDAIPTSLTLSDMQQDIKQILLNEGWVSSASQTRLLATYRKLDVKTTSIDSADLEKQLYDSMQLAITDCEKQLIKEKNLSAWFGWINYIQVLLKRSGANISSDQYLQMLQVGRASRPDNPQVAETLLKKHFQTHKLSSNWTKRYLLPFLIIVLIIFYWAKLGQEDTFSSMPSEETVKEIDVERSVSAQLTLADVKEQHKLTNQSVVTANDNMSASFGTYSFSIGQGDSLFKLSADWVKIKDLPNVRIMTTEVTNSLYAMCIQEGACSKTTIFSTSPKSNIDGKADLPKVGLSWYEVTEQFIPWLNRKAERTFSLPNLNQWQVFSRLAKYDITNNAIAHCKDCRAPVARQFNGKIMPVKIINPDRNGLYHILGNAQEWLSNCWQQQSADDQVVKRCDQAIVAGGSWMDNKTDWQDSYITQLLKTAKTPTTGFRLVEVLHE